MKKLIMTLAIVLGVTAASQGAAVVWRQGSGTFTDSNGTAISGVALLFVAPVGADAPTLTYSGGKLTASTGTYL